MVAITALLIVLCFLWISFDPWMQEVFVVYGRAFRAAVEMKAWGILYRCGWRLSLLIGMICATLGLGLDAILFSGNETSIATKVAWGILAMLAATLVPWHFVLVAIRHRQGIDLLVYEMEETAQRIVNTDDMNGSFETADYENDGDWIAWHPSQSEYAAADDRSIWRRMVPVFYTSPTVPGAVVIPIDWSNFAVWGSLPALPKIGERLPFHGPGQTTFRLRSLRQPKVGVKCWLINAEIDLCDQYAAAINPMYPNT